MKKTPLWIAINSLLAVSAPQTVLAEATKLDTIPVSSTEIKKAAQSETYDESSLGNTGNSETGSVLRQINGVDASRMGGHGLDTVIRGQSQSQLNILLDGAKIEGGCPNRMDPPTSYAETGSYDKVTVIKGVNSVEYGAGGSGGTVLFERETPKYDPAKPVSGKLSVLKSNIMNYDANAEVQAVGEKGYVVLQGSQKEANNYKDGNGDTVPSSYTTQQGHIDLGWTPNEHHELKFSYEKSYTTDALYSGAQMDSPKSDGNIYRLKYRGKDLSSGQTDGQLDGIAVDLYQSSVDHVMNNYELRPFTATMKMETLSDTKAKGAKIKLTNLIGNTKLDYGFQLQSVIKNATAYNRGNDLSAWLMWPDVHTDQNGIFAQANTALSDSQNLIYGVRVDQVTAEAKKAYDTADWSMMSVQGTKPVNLYSKYTGYSGKTKIEETNWNGLLRYEQTLSKGMSWFTGVSLTTRTADETERFMAKNDWIGNPDLKPEKHGQLDIGVAQDVAKMNWSANVYYDQVKDYILRDYAKNQPSATSLTGTQNIYVNKDATIMGAEFDMTYHMTHA
ncbi:MAG: TonB-dependent receptor, partial [Hydrogenovibrio sp.]|nr:TonB-dependent receptor [Hydrogenovibrio sp.]